MAEKARTSEVPAIAVKRDGRVAWIHLSNPPRNLLTPEMVLALDNAAVALEHDADVRVVVVTGDSDDAFITHFDVEALVRGGEAFRAGDAVSVGRATAALEAADAPWLSGSDLPVDAAAGLLALHEPLDRIGRMDKVWIAAINGLALGGGFELALACDLRYMADRPDARIGLPEALFGISPGMGGIQRLTRVVGPSRALELTLEGTLLTASQAAEIGIGHRCVAPDRLLAVTGETADRLSRRSARSVGVLKRSVYDGASLPLAAGLQLDRAGALATVGSAQGHAAMSELVRRHPSSDPLTSARYVQELEAWQQGTVIDLGGPIG